MVTPCQTHEKRLSRVRLAGVNYGVAPDEAKSWISAGGMAARLTASVYEWKSAKTSIVLKEASQSAENEKYDAFT